MRPGPLEIVLIIVAVIVVVVVARIVRSNRATARKNGAPPGDLPEATAPGNPGRPRRLLQRTGWAGIIIGILILLAAVSMFRWAFRSYLWAVIIIAVGAVIVFLSRKRG